MKSCSLFRLRICVTRIALFEMAEFHTVRILVFIAETIHVIMECVLKSIWIVKMFGAQTFTYWITMCF